MLVLWLRTSSSLPAPPTGPFSCPSARVPRRACCQPGWAQHCRLWPPSSHCRTCPLHVRGRWLSSALGPSLSRAAFTVTEGRSALHLCLSVSFLSISPSLLSGLGLGSAPAAGLPVLRMELLPPVGADAHPWPFLMGSLPVVPRAGLSRAHRQESRAGRGRVDAGTGPSHCTFLYGDEHRLCSKGRLRYVNRGTCMCWKAALQRLCLALGACVCVARPRLWAHQQDRPVPPCLLFPVSLSRVFNPKRMFLIFKEKRVSNVRGAPSYIWYRLCCQTLRGSHR